MSIQKTPGVYVEEISTLPPSVAEVSTAIPAFIGYTERGSGTARINTLLEYETLFGSAKPSAFTVTADMDQKIVEAVERKDGNALLPNFLLYYCVSHYFKNGGGSCYIISIGDYKAKPAKPAKADFLNGLTALEKEDEPTLILLTDAVHLSAAGYSGVCTAALTQCEKLKDRFAIFDVKTEKDTIVADANAFRGEIGMNALIYGAAYYPYLQTSLNYQYAEAEVDIVETSANATERKGAAEETAGNTIEHYKVNETALYHQIKAAMAEQRVVLPPSAAIAGVYARVDRNRGVWKAPANVSLSAVIGPISKITHEAQETLNVDPETGKSINAIRDFTGKGTLVWGARTLAGNDNEWRYVSVRRLFIMIEESTQKATAFAIFEPNDASTWLKVKGMIESYLYGLWERGALAGPTPESAYFVNVGLGKTMTAQDVLEGRMIVEIGVAAVRPAEFIVIRFMHKLQEA